MIYIRSAIFNFLIYFLMPIYGLLGLPFALYSREGTYGVMRAYSHTILWLMRVICGIDYEIRGEAPDTEVVLAAKHQSFIDMVLIMVALPRPRYVFKRELLYAPVLGLYGARIGGIPVARGKKGAAVRSMVEGIVKQQKADGPGQTVIFPQGTRVAPAVQAPFKIGVWKIVDTIQVPCVPTATNAGLFWGRNSFLRYPGTIVMEFLEPIPAGMEATPFMALLEERIETACHLQNVEAGYPEGRPS